MDQARQRSAPSCNSLSAAGVSRRLLALAILVGCVSPMARAIDGPYAGIQAGSNLQAPQNIRKSDSVLDTFHFNSGFAAGFYAGYAFPFGLRPDVEIDFRRNKFSHDATGQSGRGADEAASAMFNAWYDYKRPSGFFSIVHPYLGGGVGAVRFDNRGFNVGGVHRGSDFATEFGYQGGAGVSFDVRNDLTLSVDYRYLQSHRSTFILANEPGPVQEAYRSNSILFGVRYSFGTPTAPAPPPPEPPTQVVAAEPAPPPKPVCVAPEGFKVDENCKIVEQTVVLSAVDFEFNSAVLTPAARNALAPMAAALAAQPGLWIEVQGHTDSIGSASANMKLSRRRAESVMAYLVSAGVDAAHLTATGFGKTKPIASNDTPEGRAQNRRVEFDIHSAPPDVRVNRTGASADVTAAAEHGEPGAVKKTRHRSRKKAAKPSP